MSKLATNKYIGETKMMNCGLKATIIAYRKANDIDVQFENGTVREHVRADYFNQGKINETPRKKHNNYVGETRIMNCGMKACIIAYRTSKDIDVQFEDGTIRKHVSTSAFHRGVIRKEPLCTNADYIGETRTMNCGLKATIINYNRSDDIDIQFEDGSIRQHVNNSHFKTGKIAPENNILFDTYKLNKVAFVFHNKTYFYVTCTDDNSKIMDIMSVDDMKQKLPSFAQ